MKCILPAPVAVSLVLCASVAAHASGSHASVAAYGSGSHAANWQTHDRSVQCGLAEVDGTGVDQGTGAPLNGRWPGLQCSAPGIPRPRGRVGDPFVQLGQGRAGRATLVLESQDDLIANGAPATLAPGSTWRRDGITCSVLASSISCHNAFAHGFTLSRGHLRLY